MPLSQNFLIYPDTHTPVQLWAPTFHSGLPPSLLSSFAVHPNTVDGVYVNHTVLLHTHSTKLLSPGLWVLLCFVRRLLCHHGSDFALF